MTQFGQICPNGLNLHRRHLNPTQLGFVGAEVEEYYAIEARKRQAHGMTAPGSTLLSNLTKASDADKPVHARATITGGATPQLLAHGQEAGEMV